jgi:hypothetical protein
MVSVLGREPPGCRSAGWRGGAADAVPGPAVGVRLKAAVCGGAAVGADAHENLRTGAWVKGAPTGGRRP